MSPEMVEVLKLVQGGGSVALVLAVFFIYKAADRLARIEKALEILMIYLQSMVRTDPERFPAGFGEMVRDIRKEKA